jgi:hypothetical protein
VSVETKETGPQALYYVFLVLSLILDHCGSASFIASSLILAWWWRYIKYPTYTYVLKIMISINVDLKLIGDRRVDTRFIFYGIVGGLVSCPEKWAKGILDP